MWLLPDVIIMGAKFSAMEHSTKNNIQSGLILFLNVLVLGILAHGSIYPESDNAGDMSDSSLEAQGSTTGQWAGRRAGDFTFENMDNGIICNAKAQLDACDAAGACADDAAIKLALHDATDPQAVSLREQYRLVNDYLWARYGLGPLAVGATYFGLFLLLWFAASKSFLTEQTKKELADKIQQFLELLWFALQVSILHALDLSSKTGRTLTKDNGYEDMPLGLKGALIRSGCISVDDCAVKGSADAVPTQDCRDYGHVLPGVLVLSGFGVAFFLLYQIWAEERIDVMSLKRKVRTVYSQLRKRAPAGV